MLGSIAPGAVVAVIPTVFVGGPLALLALLFPALSAVLALVLRRWQALLTAVAFGSTVYLGHGWYRGYFQGSAWAGPLALWTTLTLICLAAAVWSWRRWRSRLQPAERVPRSGELLGLWAASLVTLAIVLIGLGHGDLLRSPWKGLLVLGGVLWTGTLYGQCLRLAAGWAVVQRLPAVEGVLLCALAAGCAVLAIPVPQQPAAPPFRVVWTFEPPQRGAIVSTPLLAGPHVYTSAIRASALSARGAVYCLERNSGRVVWKFDDGGAMQHGFSSPCLADGRLYIGEGMHANFVCRLYCLDAATGVKQWTFQTAGHIESSPCVADGRVFFASGDDGVYCLDAASGLECWHYQGDWHCDSSLAVAEGRVYGGSGLSRRYQRTEAFCVDAADGKVQWRLPTDLPVWGSPALRDGYVYFGLGNGRLDRSAARPAGAVLCVRADTGETVWRYDVPDGVLVRPTVAARHVYFGARDGCCYCLDRQDGRLCWKAQAGSSVVTQVALADDSLYVVASSGLIHCLEAKNGAPRWTFDLAPHTQTTPRMYSSPVAETEHAATGDRRRIYFGAELQQAVSSAALLYCLED